MELSILETTPKLHNWATCSDNNTWLLHGLSNNLVVKLSYTFLASLGLKYTFIPTLMISDAHGSFSFNQLSNLPRTLDGGLVFFL